MGPTNSDEVLRAGDLDHGHAGANVDEEVRVDVRSSLCVLHWGLLAVCENLTGYLSDKEVEPLYQTTHLIFTDDVYVQDIPHAVIELVCASSCSHDTQLSWR